MLREAVATLVPAATLTRPRRFQRLAPVRSLPMSDSGRSRVRFRNGFPRPSAPVVRWRTVLPRTAARMPARVRSERTSLSNCANAAGTPSIGLPVDVSSIGSVADRSEIPSDWRWARSAKWSYFSRAKRVRLYDHEVDPALARPAVLQQRLELGPVGRLRALAFFAPGRS